MEEEGRMEGWNAEGSAGRLEGWKDWGISLRKGTAL